jgi:glutamate racemase
MTSRDAPIGVFDSGIGGLTVVHALLARVPHERIVYVGDTARVPYGPKSPDTVRRYAAEITGWLVAQGVKMIVVACNTATAHALPSLQASIAVPVIGVIEPGARAAVRAAKGGPVGVIGTVGTIDSGAYERAIHAIDPALPVLGRACPLFVPLVEEGWLDHEVTRLIAHEYLDPLLADGVRALVLGCTHYPLLTPMLQRLAGHDVVLIDSAEETALAAAAILESAGLSAEPRATPPRHRFIASDAPDRFLALGQRFLGATLDHVEHVSFG